MNQKIIRITPATIKQVCNKERHKLIIAWDIKNQDSTSSTSSVKVDFVAQY